MESTDLIYGTRAVMEAIRAGRTIEKVMIQKGIDNDLIRDLLRTIREADVPFAWVPPEKLKRMSAKNHQGVICLLSAIEYSRVSDRVAAAFEQGREPFLVLVDRVTDVRNFGAIARTAEAVGVDALVIGSRGNAPVTSDAIKTSAGALHHLPVCREPDLVATVKSLQESGLKVIACTEKAQKGFHEADLAGPIALILGSEEDGIDEKLLRISDDLVKIPMVGRIDSLNVSVAAGIMMYAAWQARQSKAG